MVIIAIIVIEKVVSVMGHEKIYLTIRVIISPDAAYRMSDLGDDLASDCLCECFIPIIQV